jgi:multicomponent K+:H+ antiporter subunit A
VATAGQAVIGGELPYYALKIWHGFTPALFMSIGAVVGGLILLALHDKLERLWNAVPRPEAKVIFDALYGAVQRAMSALNGALHNGAISRYLAIFVVAILAAGYIAYSGAGIGPVTREALPITPIAAAGWVAMVIATALVVLNHRKRFLSLILISIIGLGVSGAFVYLSAPDLALTQISVETVTILLLLIALHFLPKYTPTESSPALRMRDGAIAIAAGVGVAALSMAFLLRDFSSISHYHLANSKTGGGGTNVVNVILVDFRGYDTYGEIIVLGIAGLVIYALMEALLSGPVGRRLRRSATPDRGALSRDRHPLMMVVATRVMLPIVLMVGVYMFLRGHNQPGGGFVAGLIVSIALLTQYMASGFAWAQERQKFEYHSLIGWGVVIAGMTGMGAWLSGTPFLTSAFGYFHFPPIEEFELATAALFDLGVFLTVLGAVMLMLYSLARIAFTSGERANPEPMDFDPARADDTAQEQTAKGV